MRLELRPSTTAPAAAPRLRTGRAGRPADKAVAAGLLVAANALGVAAFLYPLFLSGTGGGTAAAHAGDAPLLFGLLCPLLLGVAVAEVRRGALDARHVALLGVLAALNAVLRLPGSLAGASLMFFLPAIAGAAFGAGFGFLLGALSMVVSAVMTGGVGPWLPFQMWALGWAGAGGALAGPIVRRFGIGPAVAALTAYGWLAGFGYGALMNLYFWPYASGAAPAISWIPGSGIAETAGAYWRFYTLTSLAWDGSRALGNAVLTAVLGAPALRLMVRYRRRFEIFDGHGTMPRKSQARDGLVDMSSES